MILYIQSLNVVFGLTNGQTYTQTDIQTDSQTDKPMYTDSPTDAD